MTQPAQLPALFTHSKTVYDMMARETERRPVDGEIVNVWEGYATRLIQRASLSSPYYSQIFTVLQSMDCVRQIRRGGGGSPSQWQLVQSPTRELWESKNLTGVMRDMRAPGGKAALANSQQVRDVGERTNRVEGLVDTLVLAMRDLTDKNEDLETRIVALEERNA